MMKYLVPALLAIVLAGCGGGGGNGNNSAGAQVDAFYSLVESKYLAADDETSEADESVASIEPTTPEDTEPVDRG